MIYNVQALRALAAFLVVFVHLAALLELLGVHGPILNGGKAGVDLFFVISGFVMMHTTARRPTAPGAFLLNRAIRVVPLYWLLTFVIFGAALLAPGLLGATRASMADLLRSLAFVPFRKANGLIQPVLFVGWTLNYEMAFYALFAALLPVRTPARRVLLMTALLGALVVGVAAGRPAWVPLAFWGSPIVLEFAAGMAVWLAASRGWLPGARGGALLAAIGLPALIGACAFEGVARFAVAGGASVAVLAGALALERGGVVARGRLVQLLGAASYAVYLTHPFVTQAAIKLIAGSGITATAPLIAVLAAAVVAAALVGLGVHVVIERPLGRVLRAVSGHRASTIERAAPRIA